MFTAIRVESHYETSRDGALYLVPQHFRVTVSPQWTLFGLRNRHAAATQDVVTGPTITVTGVRKTP